MNRFDKVDREFDLLRNEGFGCLGFLLLTFPIFIYATSQQNYLWMAISFTLTCAIVFLVIQERRKLKEYATWLLNHEGQKIIFFPTNKGKQNNIQLFLANKLSEDVAQIYYDGPNLVGDLNKPELIMHLKAFNKERPNHPLFFKISNQKLLEICPLLELLDIVSNEEKVLFLIEKVNTY